MANDDDAFSRRNLLLSIAEKVETRWTCTVLARRLCKVPAEFLDQLISSGVAEPDRLAHKLLMKWEEVNGRSAQLRDLYSALVDCGMKNVAENHSADLLEATKARTVHAKAPEHITACPLQAHGHRKLLLDIAGNVPTRWACEKLATRLRGVPYKYVDQLYSSNVTELKAVAHNVLRRWAHVNGHSAELTDLYSALVACGMKNVADDHIVDLLDDNKLLLDASEGQPSPTLAAGGLNAARHLNHQDTELPPPEAMSANTSSTNELLKLGTQPGANAKLNYSWSGSTGSLPRTDEVQLMLEKSARSDKMGFHSANDPIQHMTAAGSVDDEQRKSPKITADSSPSRPSSQQAPSAAYQPSAATRNSNTSVGDRIGGGSGSIGSVGDVSETIFASTIPLMEDEDQGGRKGKLLGRGGFGQVYEYIITGKTIAMKEMELSSDAGEANQQFSSTQKEVNILRRLAHNNIVKYLGASLCEGSNNNFKVRIFMDLIEGGSIANRVKDGALPMQECQAYTLQILSAVEYLHDGDIIHRDIKGANIMVTNKGIVKLIDFGTAKHHLHGQTNSEKGTPYWMAPEVIRRSKYEKPVDIWSVGCTVFEMAVGHHPWYGREVQAAIFAIGSYRKPKELEEAEMPSMVRDFIKQCMTDEPDQRPTATSLLLNHGFMRLEYPLSRIGQETLPERLPARGEVAEN